MSLVSSDPTLAPPRQRGGQRVEDETECGSGTIWTRGERGARPAAGRRTTLQTGRTARATAATPSLQALFGQHLPAALLCRTTCAQCPLPRDETYPSPPRCAAATTSWPPLPTQPEHKQQLPRPVPASDAPLRWGSPPEQRSATARPEQPRQPPPRPSRAKAREADSRAQ